MSAPVPTPTHRLNRRTQPLRRFPVFNRWDVVSRGWWVVCRSAELRAGSLRTVTLRRQRLVVFRGEDGRLGALDAFCPHMGTELGAGRVAGNHVRCFFHHWEFDRSGACVAVPALRRAAGAAGAPLPRAKLRSYAVAERYGFVWVWPEAVAPSPPPAWPDLGEEAEVLVWHDTPFDRSCHHHVTMINGIDPQHLATVHGLSIEMALSLDEAADGRVADFTLSGAFPPSLAGRLGARLFGPRYTYTMRYVDASVGLLRTAVGLRWLGRGAELPCLHTGYAYQPLEEGRTRVYPFFVAPRGRGPLGALLARLRLLLAWLGFRFLRDQDGRVYDHMRFDPAALLPVDAPVARFVAWVNRLRPSDWSDGDDAPDDDEGAPADAVDEGTAAAAVEEAAADAASTDAPGAPSPPLSPAPRDPPPCTTDPSAS